MDKDIINWPRYAVVLCMFLFFLSGTPTVSSQENPYAPEIDFSCSDYSPLSVEYDSNYGEVDCSISNRNPHDVTVKITEEWEHSISGPYELSEYGVCMDTEIGDEIYVQGSSTVSFCYKITADKYTTAVEYILTSTAEVVTYLSAIPCDSCEPISEEVQVEIIPWFRIDYDYSATPESAYSYNYYGSERVVCGRSDFSELLLDINLDGNFLGTINLSAEFSFQPNIRDLRLDGYVDYSESTFGEVNLEYDPEPLTFKAGETVRRSFKASWDIKEDTDNYDIELITVLDVRMEAGYHVFRMIDFCPEWKGVLPAQEINLNNEPSGGSFNLNSSFSMPLSVVSMVMAAAVLRKE